MSTIPHPRRHRAARRTAEPAAAPGAGRRLVAAVDERLGIDALRYPVPEHANNLTWSLGGLTAATLLILIATGIVLAQFYNPTPEVANASVRNIELNVFLGRLIRGVHYWGAQAMYVLAALHLLRVVFHGSYKRPREANWLIGVTMFALTIGAVFTGTVLKWDQEGYEALEHNLEIGNLLGGVGFWFSPEFAQHTPILVRLYAAHVVIIPVLLLGLVTLHALLIKRHRISPHPALQPRPPADRLSHAGEQARPDEPTEPFTHHLRRISAFALVLLAGLMILAVLVPPAVGPTPVAGVEVTKPPWMFWWMFTLENWLGLSGILWGSAVLFAVLVAVPFVDRGPERHWRRRPVAIGLAAAIVLAIIVLSLLTLLTTPAQHLMG